MKYFFKTLIFMSFLGNVAFASESPLQTPPQVDVCDFVDLESCH